MHPSTVNRTERKCASFSTAQHAIKLARSAAERAHGATPPPAYDSIEVSVTTVDGVREVVAVKQHQLPTFLATLATDGNVVRIRVGRA